MIYTLTANLAVDLFISTKNLKPNFVNRTEYFETSANGKGVNVSLILKKLGIDSVVTGFRGGFTGAYIKEEMDRQGVKNFLPEIDGITRINVFTHVVEENREYTQVNPGPRVSERAKDELISYFSKALKEGDILSINGSFPEGIDIKYLNRLFDMSNEKRVKIVIDNSSKIIPDLCKYKPFIIKPNEVELCSWFDEKVEGTAQFINLSRRLIERGAENILLSLGKDGAMLINKDEVLKCNAPKGEVVNTAMAGDTLLATFIGEKIHGKSDEKALKKSVCAGSSTAFSNGLTDFSDVDSLMTKVEVIKMG